MNELNNAYNVLTEAILKSEKFQTEWSGKELQWKKQTERLVKSQNQLSETNKIQAEEISNLQENLITASKIHTNEISRLETKLSELNENHIGCGDKIAAYRNVARALESENQLLSGEKENLQNFKTQFCKDNGALKVAVDQIDNLRRLLLNKDEELKHLHNQFEYQEIEKIKIVKKLAQVEQDLDVKTHELRKVKNQLGDKEDTLNVLRVSKRDIEIRLQNQILYNNDLTSKLEKSKQTQEQLQALESILVEQESINESKMRDVQINLNLQIDEINQTKEVEMESLKSRYADLFDEKAHELQSLRADYSQCQVKIQQQSRTISDLQFKEKELNDLLSKKQNCHHKEFERTQNELLSEIEFLREISIKSETELRLIENKFAEFKEKIVQKLKSTHSEISGDDSGIFSKSSNNHDTSSESLTVQNSQPIKRKRGKKKRR